MSPVRVDAPIGAVFGSLRVLGDAGHREYPSGGRHYMWLVECVNCGDQTIKANFRVRNEHLTHGCSACAHTASRGAGSPHWRGGAVVPAYFVAKVKKGCARRSREIAFTISIDYLDALWIEQDGRCALTGWPLRFGDHATEQTASLDRIDPRLGYIEGNVQFVHKAVNVAKWAMSQQDFIAMCQAVATHSQEGEQE